MRFLHLQPFFRMRGGGNGDWYKVESLCRMQRMVILLKYQLAGATHKCDTRQSHHPDVESD